MHKRFLLAVGAAAVFGVTVCQAGVVSITGAIEVISPPFSVQQNVLTSDEVVQFLHERHALRLAESIEVDVSTSGRFDEAADLTPAAVDEGTFVNSYLLHLNSGPSGRFQGEIVFGEPVLGLALSRSRLEASNPVLGAPGTTYPAPASSDAARAAVEWSNGTSLTVDQSANRLAIDFRPFLDANGGSFYHHVRVLTLAELPDYNGNGRVEQVDLDLVLLNWGDDTPPIPDGWIRNLPAGRIDQAELDGVLLNWGRTHAGPLSAAAVPEPGTLTLAALLLLGIITGRRRRVAG